ncbi:Ig-specific serine endopeptidase MIP [Mycoplasma feriruminatoris]|uniref:Membrane-associated lipoprotein n=1 Tax=Mycoplasma feriruminatoris TaxID=1179777 RepID=A0A654IP06_9MOLU|nr:Membrane-associated lipoprotein [Mycoplasma feriruminatoris]
MTRLNKLLMLISSSTLALPLTLLVSCTSVSKKIISKPIDDKEFLKLVQSIQSENDLLKYADIKFKNSLGTYVNKAEILPTQLEKSYIEITFKDKYENQIFSEVVNVIPSRSVGFSAISEAMVYAELKNSKTGKTKSINFKITGLNKNKTVDAFNQQINNGLEYFNGESGYVSYTQKNQKQRFDFDNKKYITALEHNVNNGSTIDLKKYRNLETKKEHIDKFDKQANNSNFDTYYNAAIKGFTLPVYDDKGEVTGLQINDNPEVNKGHSVVDSLGRDRFKTNGLARTIPNEVYKTAAIQTYQVTFNWWKDYSEEIEQANEYIELFSSWTDDQVKSYVGTQLRQLELNFKDDTREIDKQLKETAKDRENIIKTLKEQKTKIDDKYKQDKEKFTKLNKDQLIALQRNEIEEYQKKKDQTTLRDSESGTMWIMDYIDENNPTKFYFGTNSHVAKAIRDNLVSFSLTRLNSDISVGQTFNLNGFDKNFTKFVFEKNENGNKLNEAVSAIFHATDFIKEASNPLNMLEEKQKDKYKDAGIFADFAVIEIDFAKLLNNSDYKHTIWSESHEISNKYKDKKDELISLITNDYVKTGKKIQFESESLLDDKKYKTFDRKLDFNPNIEKELQDYKYLNSLYILGYPIAVEDYYLDKYEDYKQLQSREYDYSLWVNSEYKYYKNLVKKEGTPPSFKEYETEKGNFFSYQIGYRSFIDKPGLTDAFLAAHRVGKKLYTLNENGKPKKYFNYGLEILPRFYAPSGGASGSSVRTKDNKLLAVFHAANNSAKTGLAAVFRSYGYDYKNLFGKYNLGQYDLIYGGGKDQETGKSYREVMNEKYKDKNFKSALFKEGFEKVPSEFEFKNKETI